VAEFAISVEEELGVECIPETSRIHLVCVATDIAERKIDVTCHLRSAQNEWHKREGTVYF
jgi:hypothetical protein